VKRPENEGAAGSAPTFRAARRPATCDWPRPTRRPIRPTTSYGNHARI